MIWKQALVCAALSVLCVSSAQAAVVINDNDGVRTDDFSDNSGWVPGDSSGVVRDAFGQRMTLDTSWVAPPACCADDTCVDGEDCTPPPPVTGHFTTVPITPSSFERWTGLYVDRSQSAPGQVQVYLELTDDADAISQIGPLPLVASPDPNYNAYVDLTPYGLTPANAKSVRIVTTLSTASPLRPSVNKTRITWDARSVVILALETPASTCTNQQFNLRLRTAINFVDAAGLVLWAPLPDGILPPMPHPTAVPGGFAQADMAQYVTASDGGFYHPGPGPLVIGGNVIPGNSVVWNLDARAAGQTFVVSATLRVPQGLLNNTSYEVSAHAAASNAAPTSTNPTTLLVTPPTPAPATFRSVSGTYSIGGVQHVYPDATLTFNLSGRNHSSTLAGCAEHYYQAVVFDDVSPLLGKIATPGGTFASGLSITGGGVYTDSGLTLHGVTIPAHSVYWDLTTADGRLDVGESFSRSYTVTLAGAPPLVDGSDVTQCSALRSGFRVQQSSACNTFRIGVPTTPKGVYAKGDRIAGSSAIRVGYNDNPSSNVTYGDRFSWLLSARNTAVSALYNTVFLDMIPPGATFDSALLPETVTGQILYYTGAAYPDPNAPPPLDATGYPSPSTGWTATVPADKSQVRWVWMRVATLASTYFPNAHAAPSQVTAEIAVTVDNPAGACAELAISNRAHFYTFGYIPLGLEAQPPVMLATPLTGADTEWVNVRPITPHINNFNVSASPTIRTGSGNVNVSVSFQNRQPGNTATDTLLDTTVTIDIPKVKINGVLTTLPITSAVTASGGVVDTSGLPERISVTYGSIPPNAGRSISFTLFVPRGFEKGATFTIPASAVGNDDICGSTSATAARTVTLTAEPSLKLTKAVDFTIADQGSPLNYTLGYVNVGDVVSTKTWLVDPIHPALDFVSAQGNGTEVWFSYQDPPTLPDLLSPSFQFNDTNIRANFVKATAQDAEGRWLPPLPNPTYVAFLVDDDALSPPSLVTDTFRTVDFRATIRPSTPDGTVVHNDSLIVSAELLQAIALRVTSSVLPDPSLQMNLACGPPVAAGGGGTDFTVAYYNDSLNLDTEVYVDLQFPVGMVFDGITHTWNAEAALAGYAHTPTVTDLGDGLYRVQIIAPGDDPPLEALEGGTLVIHSRVDPANTPPSGELLQVGLVGVALNTEGQSVALASCTTLVSNPDLLVTKLVDQDDPPAGTTVTYTLAIANNGAHFAPDVVVTDTLPAGLTYEPGSAQLLTPGWTGATPTVSGQTLTWSQLKKGANDAGWFPGNSETVFISFRATVDAGVPANTTLTNCVSATTSLTQDDLVPHSGCAPVKTPLPNLIVTKTAPPQALPGQVITYTLRYANQSRQPAERAYLIDRLPYRPSDSYPNVTEVTFLNAVGTHGEAFYFHEGSITAPPPAFDPLAPTTNGWTATPAPRSSWIAILPPAATPLPAQSTYRQVLVDVRLRHPLSQLAPLPGSSFENCVTAYLPLGAGETLADVDDDPSDNTACATTQTPGVDVAAAATCAPEDGITRPGDVAEYTIEVVNTGTTTLYGLRVTPSPSPLLAVAEFDPAVAEPTDGAGQPVTFIDLIDNPLGDPVAWTPVGGDYLLGSANATDPTFYRKVGLRPGHRARITLRGLISDQAADEAPVLNGVNVVTDYRTDFVPGIDKPEEYLVNNAASCAITVYRPDLYVTKTAVNLTRGADAPAEAGDVLAYTLEIGNLGRVPADGVELQDLLPTGVSFVPNSFDGDTTNALLQFTTSDFAWNASGGATGVVGLRMAFTGDLATSGSRQLVLSLASDFALGTVQNATIDEQNDAVVPDAGLACASGQSATLPAGRQVTYTHTGVSWPYDFTWTADEPTSFCCLDPGSSDAYTLCESMEADSGNSDDSAWEGCLQGCTDDYLNWGSSNPYDGWSYQDGWQNWLSCTCEAGADAARDACYVEATARCEDCVMQAQSACMDDLANYTFNTDELGQDFCNDQPPYWELHTLSPVTQEYPYGEGEEEDARQQCETEFAMQDTWRKENNCGDTPPSWLYYDESSGMYSTDFQFAPENYGDCMGGAESVPYDCDDNTSMWHEEQCRWTEDISSFCLDNAEQSYMDFAGPHGDGCGGEPVYPCFHPSECGGAPSGSCSDRQECAGGSEEGSSFTTPELPPLADRDAPITVWQSVKIDVTSLPYEGLTVDILDAEGQAIDGFTALPIAADGTVALTTLSATAYPVIQVRANFNSAGACLRSVGETYPDQGYWDTGDGRFWSTTYPLGASRAGTMAYYEPSSANWTDQVVVVFPVDGSPQSLRFDPDYDSYGMGFDSSDPNRGFDVADDGAVIGPSWRYVEYEDYGSTNYTSYAAGRVYQPDAAETSWSAVDLPLHNGSPGESDVLDENGTPIDTDAWAFFPFNWSNPSMERIGYVAAHAGLVAGSAFIALEDEWIECAWEAFDGCRQGYQQAVDDFARFEDCDAAFGCVAAEYDACHANDPGGLCPSDYLDAQYTDACPGFDTGACDFDVNNYTTLVGYSAYTPNSGCSWWRGMDNQSASSTSYFEADSRYAAEPSRYWYRSSCDNTHSPVPFSGQPISFEPAVFRQLGPDDWKVERMELPSSHGSYFQSQAFRMVDMAADGGRVLGHDTYSNYEAVIWRYDDNASLDDDNASTTRWVVEAELPHDNWRVHGGKLAGDFAILYGPSWNPRVYYFNGTTWLARNLPSDGTSTTITGLSPDGHVVGMRPLANGYPEPVLYRHNGGGSYTLVPLPLPTWLKWNTSQAMATAIGDDGTIVGAVDAYQILASNQWSETVTTGLAWFGAFDDPGSWETNGSSWDDNTTWDDNISWDDNDTWNPDDNASIPHFRLYDVANFRPSAVVDGGRVVGMYDYAYCGYNCFDTSYAYGAWVNDCWGGDVGRLDALTLDYETGAKRELTFEVTVDDVCQTSIGNTATVSGTVTEVTLSNNTSTATTSVNTADLEATVRLDKSAVSQGETLTVTFEVTNRGPGTAYNVQALGTPPQETSGDATGYTIGELASGATWSTTLPVTVLTNEPNLSLISRLDVTTDTIDCVPDNDAATRSAVTGSWPNLAVQKTGPATAVVSTAGPTEFAYTLAWQSDGNDVATNAVLVDTLPPLATFVSASNGGVYDGVTHTVTWPLGALAPGASDAFEVTVAAPGCAAVETNLVNQVEIASSSFEADVADNTASATTYLLAPGGRLGVRLFADRATAEPGDRVIYTAHYQNAGTAPVTAAELTVPTPTNATYAAGSANGAATVGAGGITWALGTLAPGEVGSVTFAVDVDGDFGDAVAIADGAATLTGVGACATTATGVSTQVTQPGLHIVKHADRATLCADDQGQITWSITAVNTSAQPIAGVVVTDTIPAGTSYVGGSITGLGANAANSPNLQWAVGTMAPGQGVTLTYRTTAPPTNLTIITNTARVGATALAAVDSAPAAVMLDCGPNASVSLAWDATCGLLSSEAAVTVGYRNRGAATLTDAAVTVALPPGLDFVSSADGGTWDPATRVVTFTRTLAPGASGQATFTVAYAATVESGQLFELTAGLTAGEVNAAGNRIAGVTLDCAPAPQCQSLTCDLAGQCVYPAADEGLTCDDASACTEGDVCAGGACVGEAIDCDDGNQCTENSCDPTSGCVDTVLTGQACIDGDACTLGDVCNSEGACVGGAPRDCDDGNVCTDDSCDEAIGCVNEPNSDPCDDGNACTAGDVCAGGTCLSGDNTCECQADADCAQFDDGDLCTGVLICQDNACVTAPGTVVTCAPSTVACQLNVCEPSTGVCGLVAGDDGGSCSDGDPCTLGDFCDAGACVAGAGEATCPDADACNAGVCVPGEGCATEPLTGTACDDGSVCTPTDTCVAGACVGEGSLGCPGDGDNPCVTPVCDPITGCGLAFVEGSCDDGDDCTANDACVLGQCLGETFSCDDSNPCTDGVCLPDGTCDYVPNANACDDGDACTSGDVCADGVCQPGVATTCADTGNPCTTAVCVDGGCVEQDVDGGACGDSGACTVGGVCAGGACVGGEPKDCDDGDECTLDSCDETTGECTHTLMPLDGVTDLCDGVDDDCDGLTDEDHDEVATSCGVGACEGNVGVLACVDGVVEDTCDELEGATYEECNGIDDDCNGFVDEIFPDLVCGEPAVIYLVITDAAGQPVGSARCFEQVAGGDIDCETEADEQQQQVLKVYPYLWCPGE